MAPSDNLWSITDERQGDVASNGVDEASGPRKGGHGDWWQSRDGTGGKEMIATDVWGTEKNDRYWVWGSGDIFYDSEICLVVLFF